MSGLIKKDFLSIKRQARVFVFLAVIYTAIAYFSAGPSFFQGFVIILSSMMPVTALAYDERAHFERYALTMPLSRKRVVVAKYLFGLICIGIALVINVVFEILLSIIRHTPVSETLPVTMLVLLGVALFFLSVNLPVMFKFGTEKGRLIYMGLAVLAILLPMLLQDGTIGSPPAFLVETLVYAFPAVAALMFLLSMRISIGIYKRKEFS